MSEPPKAAFPTPIGPKTIPDPNSLSRDDFIFIRELIDDSLSYWDDRADTLYRANMIRKLTLIRKKLA